MMYYEYEDRFYSEEEIDEVLYESAKANIDAFIDEGEEVKIFNIVYSPSEVLKKVDPIAYKCAIDDYADTLREDCTEYTEEEYSEMLREEHEEQRWRERNGY